MKTLKLTEITNLNKIRALGGVSFAALGLVYYQVMHSQLGLTLDLKVALAYTLVIIFQSYAAVKSSQSYNIQRYRKKTIIKEDAIRTKIQRKRIKAHLKKRLALVIATPFLSSFVTWAFFRYLVIEQPYGEWFKWSLEIGFALLFSLISFTLTFLASRKFNLTLSMHPNLSYQRKRVG